MPHRPEKLLQDIVDAAEAIRSFTAGKTLEDYRDDLLLRSGVERQFEIIGEALRRLRETDQHLAQFIDHFRKILAFRNIIAHGYDILNSAVVWDVAQKDLPRLRADAEALLAALQSGQGPEQQA